MAAFLRELPWFHRNPTGEKEETPTALIDRKYGNRNRHLDFFAESEPRLSPRVVVQTAVSGLGWAHCLGLSGSLSRSRLEPARHAHSIMAAARYSS